jgi:hypothetical protein
MGHKPTLTRFPRERPDVGWYLSCQRDVPNSSFDFRRQR